MKQRCSHWLSSSIQNSIKMFSRRRRCPRIHQHNLIRHYRGIDAIYAYLLVRAVSALATCTVTVGSGHMAGFDKAVPKPPPARLIALPKVMLQSDDKHLAVCCVLLLRKTQPIHAVGARVACNQSVRIVGRRAACSPQ